MPQSKPDSLSHFVLTLNGVAASKEAMDALLSCSVETTLNLPDMCLMRIHDTDFHWIDSPLFREGVRLKVELAWDQGAPKTLFEGEIVALEMDLDAHSMPTIAVRAYDRSHRLHRGRHSRTFVQMTDADIVKKIAEEDGFTPRIRPTTVVHDWLMQNNQTNWEFLNQCAVRCGYRLFLQGEKTLCFEPMDYSSTVLPLEWGKDMLRFRPHIAAGQQVNEVTVRGWNPKTKSVILGKASAADGVPKVGMANGSGVDGGMIAKKNFGAAAQFLVDHPIENQSEADKLAQSLCDAIGNEFLEAEGVAQGNPNLQPGVWVEIKNVGQRFSGKYFVTSARHVYGSPPSGGGSGAGSTGGSGYQTHFQVSGKRPPILLSLLQNGNGAAQGGQSHPNGGNIVIGLVTDNNDPNGQSRVKVKYPHLTEEHTSDWARVVSPMAGNGRGFHCLPEVGDEVLVAFEQGAITRPYILGALWNGKDSPAAANGDAVSGGMVNKRSFKTRIGHLLLLDDTGGKGCIELHTKDERVVRLSDADQSIKLTDRAGNSVTISSTDNSIVLSCLGNLSISAKGKITIDGLAGVDVTGTAGVNITGIAGVKVTGTAGVQIISTAPIIVQGLPVEIN